MAAIGPIYFSAVPYNCPSMRRFFSTIGYRNIKTVKGCLVLLIFGPIYPVFIDLASLSVCM